MATFARRGTELPRSIAEALRENDFTNLAHASLWKAYRDRNGLTLAPEDLSEAGRSIRLTFANPLALALEMPSKEIQS